MFVHALIWRTLVLRYKFIKIKDIIKLICASSIVEINKNDQLKLKFYEAYLTNIITYKTYKKLTKCLSVIIVQIFADIYPLLLSANAFERVCHSKLLLRFTETQMKFIYRANMAALGALSHHYKHAFLELSWKRFLGNCFGPRIDPFKVSGVSLKEAFRQAFNYEEMSKQFMISFKYVTKLYIILLIFVIPLLKRRLPNSFVPFRILRASLWISICASLIHGAGYFNPVNNPWLGIFVRYIAGYISSFAHELDVKDKLSEYLYSTAASSMYIWVANIISHKYLPFNITKVFAIIYPALQTAELCPHSTFSNALKGTWE